MNPMSMNKSEDPESIRLGMGVLGSDSVVTGRMRASGVVVVEAFKVTVVCAQILLTQPSGGAWVGGLLNHFPLLPRRWWLVLGPWRLLRPLLWTVTWSSPWLSAQFFHKTGKGCSPCGAVAPLELVYHLCRVSQ